MWQLHIQRNLDLDFCFVEEKKQSYQNSLDFSQLYSVKKVLIFPSACLNFKCIFLNALFTLFVYLFIYFWLCWVFISVQGLSLVVASGGHSSSRCAGLSLSRPLAAEHRLQTRRLSSCGSQCQYGTGTKTEIQIKGTGQKAQI